MLIIFFPIWSIFACKLVDNQVSEFSNLHIPCVVPDFALSNSPFAAGVIRKCIQQDVRGCQYKIVRNKISKICSC